MARLGTKANPLIVRVPSEERAAEVTAYCGSHNWYVICELNDEEEEDLTDIEEKLNAPTLSHSEPRIGRNDPCFCGSGKKFKRCCIDKAIPPTEHPAEQEKICAHCAIEEWLDGP
jgi:SWIM/SEC-C metal-binding protein